MDLTEPFYRHFAIAPAEEAVNAVVALHEEGGSDQISLSSIARVLGCSRSSVHEAHGGLQGLYVSLAVRFGTRWLDWISDASFLDVPIRLPEDELDRSGVRAWSSIRAAAASEARVGRPAAWRAVAHVLKGERALLAEWMRHAGEGKARRKDVDGLMALADGLRRRMTQPTDVLSHEQATTLLSSFWTGHLGLASLRIED